MDKREAIERALGESLERAMDAGDETHGQVHRFLNRDYYKEQILDALAEQAIVIECEVEHLNGDTSIFINEIETNFWFDGLRGTQGKALAIILPDRATNHDTRIDSSTMEEGK